jgi:hypothetical protein
MPIKVQKAYRTPHRHDQSRTYTWHITVRAISTKNKVREKNQIIYKGKPIKIKARREERKSKNFWNLMKMKVRPTKIYETWQRGKFIAMSAYIKYTEISQTT